MGVNVGLNCEGGSIWPACAIATNSSGGALFEPVSFRARVRSTMGPLSETVAVGSVVDGADASALLKTILFIAYIYGSVRILSAARNLLNNLPHSYLIP